MSEDLQYGPEGANDPPVRSTFTPPPPPASTPPPKKKNPFAWIPWVIILALGGIVIYLLQNKGKLEDNRDELLTENTRVDSSYNSVNTEYQASLARIDNLMSQNEGMARELEDRNGEVAKLKAEINSTLNKKNKTSGDYEKARQLIKQLNNKVRGYEERIAELEAQNAALSATNTNVARQRDSTTTENTGLQEKVKLGAVLHASNIRMIPIDLRRGGSKEKETTKARRVDLLRILFDIDENRVAESGPKDLYIKIMDPDGQLISNASIGSGVTTGAGGERIDYTLQKQVMLTQNERARDVNIDWSRQDDYQRGTYRIYIYNEGYPIGSGSVTLR